jgi:ribosome-binding factor A
LSSPRDKCGEEPIFILTLSLSKHEGLDFSKMSRNRSPRGPDRGDNPKSRRPSLRAPRSDSGPSQRQLRVGEALRHALAEVLRRNEIRDPDLDGVSVTITQVKPSSDMRYATVYCEPLGGQNAKQIVAALNRHKGFLRGEMGHMITTKFTPDLRFVEDESFAEALKIDTILRSERVSRDIAAPEGSEDGEEE